MDLHRYRLAGLPLLSEFALPLPHWPSGIAATQPPVRIYSGAAPRLSAPSARRLLLEVADDDYWLEIPGIARYRVRGGQEVVIEPAAGASPADVAAYLCSYALAALCCQRGLLVVHATALGCSGRAVLLIGASACGKSTLGACLAARGAQVLSDDLCIIDTGGECALVQPSIRQLALWPDSATHLGLVPAEASQPGAVGRKQSIAVGAEPTAALPVHLVLVKRGIGLMNQADTLRT